MDAVFPVGFPLPTAFYLVFYVFTLIIHVVFMNYVLAGSGYVAFKALARRAGQVPAPGLSAEAVLQDWLPFALGAAITAGVAPLLFVQILYQRAFYTANLLLFHRWMSILPVLIVAFYLLYLAKSGRVLRRSQRWQALICLGSFLGFAWTGYSWTENHLLSSASKATWKYLYESGDMFYFEREMCWRLPVWFLGAIPTMSLLVGWQLWRAQRRKGAELAPGEAARLARMATLGVVLSAVFATLLFRKLPPEQSLAFWGAMTWPYVIVGALGVVLQLGGWIWQWVHGRCRLRCLLVATIGTALCLVGMTVIREAVRLSKIPDAAWLVLQARHQQAFAASGFVVFLFFFVLCAVLVSTCIVLAGRQRQTRAA